MLLENRWAINSLCKSGRELVPESWFGGRTSLRVAGDDIAGGAEDVRTVGTGWVGRDDHAVRAAPVADPGLRALVIVHGVWKAAVAVGVGVCVHGFDFCWSRRGLVLVLCC